MVDEEWFLLMDFDSIRRQIVRAGGTPGEPAQEKIFDEFEGVYHVTLSPQVKANYLIMNGSAYCTQPGGSWMRFWPLEEWRSVHEAFPNDAVANTLPQGVFVCADYAYECVYFAVDLASPRGRVYGLGASRVGVAGADFNEFVARVADDSDEVHNYG